MNCKSKVTEFAKLPVRIACLGLLTAGVGILGGCGGSDLSPVAPEGEEVSAPTASKPTRTTVKAVDDGTHSKSMADSYWPNYGAYLWVNFNKHGSRSDVVVKDAWFTVASGALGKEQVDLSMEVTCGTTLADVDVKFLPSGLTFDPPAKLSIRLAGPVTAEDLKQAEHERDDGTWIESIETETLKNGNTYIVVTVAVPGFSRYSLSADEAAALSMSYDTQGINYWSFGY